MKWQIPVSIIIIAYNDAAHIATAIRSACTQTLHDIQIVCVDDGSNDQTLNIMQDYATMDKRIEVYTQSNQGTYSARRTGVLHADGEYVLFLDSDDELVPHAAELLINSVRQTECDVLEFGVNLRLEKNVDPNGLNVGYMRQQFSPNRPLPQEKHGDVLVRDCFVKRSVSWFVWNKLYRRKLLCSAFRFWKGERICMNEDVLIVLMVLCHTQCYGRIDQELYVYHVGTGISTRSRFLNTATSVKNYALAFRVYMLAREWTAALDMNSVEIQEAVDVLRGFMTEVLFKALFYQCKPQMQGVFLEHLREYCSKEEFCSSLIRYVFDEEKAFPGDALAALRGSWITETSVQQVSTVAMYCRKLDSNLVRLIQLMSKDLLTAGYRVIFVTEQEMDVLKNVSPEEIRVVALGTDGTVPTKRVQRWKSIIQQEKIDAVIYHTWMEEWMPLDSLSCKVCGILFVAFAHFAADEPMCRDRKWLDQSRLFALTDIIITGSDIDFAWWQALGLHAAQVAIPFSVDVNAVKIANLKSKNVLWVGKLDDWETYRQIVDIAKHVHKSIPDIHVYILDQDEKNGKTEAFIDDLHLSGQEEYIHYKNCPKNLYSYYSDASVLLSTAQVQGFPMTLIESKLYGIPVVAYEISNSYFQHHSEAIFIVQQNNWRAAAQRIITLMKDFDFRKREGCKAREDIERFNYQSAQQVWKQIINSSFSYAKVEERKKHRLPIEIAIVRAINAITCREKREYEEIKVVRKLHDEAHTELYEVRKELFVASHELQQLRNELRKTQIEVISANHNFKEMEEKYKNDIDSIINSNTWKIGRIITYCPIKLKSFYRKLKVKGYKIISRLFTLICRNR